LVNDGISNDLSYDEVMDILIEEKLLDLINKYSNLEIAQNQYDTHLKQNLKDLLSNSFNETEKYSESSEQLRDKFSLAVSQNRFANHTILLNTNIGQSRTDCSNDGIVEAATTSAATGCVVGAVAGGLGCGVGAVVGATAGTLAWSIKCAYKKIKGEK